MKKHQLLSKKRILGAKNQPFDTKSNPMSQHPKNPHVDFWGVLTKRWKMCRRVGFWGVGLGF
jgi:hypothetical protein